MKKIPVMRDQWTLVDDKDFEQLSTHKWYAKRSSTGKLYAYRRERGPGRIIRYMHREILGLTDPKVHTDHRDGDSLNNRRGNLRQATPAQNQAGTRRKKISSSSKYRGVSRHLENSSWVASIQSEGKSRYLGSFKVERDAALTYDKAAVQLFGVFASPNFPEC